MGSGHDPKRRVVRSAAAIMVGVAILLIVAGVALMNLGGETVKVFGLLTLGWGIGGLGAALVFVIRAWRL